MRFGTSRVLFALVAVLVMSAVAATSAWASGAPFVETKRDTGVGETKATLNGVVNPNGLETKYYFEYGTTAKTFGSKTAEASAGSGTSNVEESKALTGLKADTTYYYRIVATNSDGTTDGAEEVFYTTATLLPEFKPVPTKKKFKTTGGEFVWLEPLGATGSNTITCAKSTSTGEITGASSVGKLVTKFTGCKMVVDESGSEKGPCEMRSPGANPEEIVTKSLKGELGTVKTTEAASGAGMLLEGEAGKVLWETAATGEPCKTIETAVEGNLAGEVSPMNTKQLTSKLTFAAKGVGFETKQDIKEITVKKGPVQNLRLKWLGSLTSTVSQADTTTFEEALEVTL